MNMETLISQTASVEFEVKREKQLSLPINSSV